MREAIDLISVAVLIEALPEFIAVLERLSEDFDEDLTPEVVFGELAALAARRLAETPRDDAFLDRLFGAVELVATTPGIDAESIIGYGFLLALDDESVALAYGYLGESTAAIEALLSAGEL